LTGEVLAEGEGREEVASHGSILLVAYRCVGDGVRLRPVTHVTNYARGVLQVHPDRPTGNGHAADGSKEVFVGNQNLQE
jgi:hypothetical protein